MILEKIFEGIGNVYIFLLGFINIPGMPNDVFESAKNYLTLLFENASLLGLFIRISTVKTIATIFLVIISARVLYKLFKFFALLHSFSQ